MFAKLVTSRQLFFSTFAVRWLESDQALHFFSLLFEITVNKFNSANKHEKFFGLNL